ncbi:unnamed protein product [Blepharisma stoltei]|uniref:Activator of Hsp90 ATPase AHSA1-like N-terminal domain-containing protein n=1 Tax=Blepharisma stoltei TaxID=1481888 RepID=A0AAU9JA57_9CILI|nr:unnamed protein product [Blepharisma stoltei]
MLGSGAGSVWNANSWHWEEKNYKIWAQNRFKELLLGLSFTHNSWRIYLDSITEIKNSASVMIRKGKTILLFEFEVDASWKANKDDKEESGTLKIQEFNQDEADEIIVMAEPTKENDDSWAIKIFLQREAKAQIVEIVNQFANEFKELESNQAKFAEDRNKRKEEEDKRKAAIEQNSAEQERLSKLAQEREEVLKKANQENKPIQLEDNKAQGSVWNAGSYFWEEKSVNWAADRLKELIKMIHFEIPAGNISITEVNLQGDASISIRKAKKIVTYSYIIDVKWVGKIFDGEGNELRSCKGTVHLPDVSMDVEPNFEIQIKIDEPGPENELIKYYMDAQGKPAIISQIQTFIQELKNS